MKMRQAIWGFLTVSALFGFGVHAVFAQDISVEATVDTTTVQLGTSFQLTVTVNGADTVPPIQLPKVDGLETRYLGPSTKISIINGKMSRSTGMIFSVIPLRTGTFQIPALSIPLSGKDYQTEAITISVVDSGAAATAGNRANQMLSNGRDISSALQDKIFIVLSTPKNEAYMGEPIPVTVKLFINNLTVKNVQYPAISNDGFTADQFGEPDRKQQVLGGIAYQVLEFKTTLYPTRTGELSLGPAKLGANILIQSSRRRGIAGDLGNIFDDDLFDNFFNLGETKTIMLESAKLGIKILPLPKEGQPASFSGGVGKFNYDVSVSPRDLKVGDPITVRMRIAGEGNLKAITFPAYKETADIKAYDPKIIEQDAARVLEQVVIPKSEKVKELPAADFSYYDPFEKKYFTVTKGPFPLNVSPLARGEESKVVGLNTESAAQPLGEENREELGQDIHFMKENVGRLHKRGHYYFQNIWFNLILLSVILIWLGCLGNHVFQHRLSTDQRFARRLQAPRHAKNGLTQAQKLLALHDVRGFYDILHKTVMEFLSNKFHLSVGIDHISLETIKKELKNIPKENDLVKNLQDLMDECELVKFASAQVTDEMMRAALNRSQEIIDFFERNYK